LKSRPQWLGLDTAPFFLAYDPEVALNFSEKNVVGGGEKAGNQSGTVDVVSKEVASGHLHEVNGAKEDERPECPAPWIRSDCESCDMECD